MSLTLNQKLLQATIENARRKQAEEAENYRRLSFLHQGLCYNCGNSVNVRNLGDIGYTELSATCHNCQPTEHKFKIFGWALFKYRVPVYLEAHE